MQDFKPLSDLYDNLVMISNDIFGYIEISPDSIKRINETIIPIKDDTTKFIKIVLA